MWKNTWLKELAGKYGLGKGWMGILFAVLMIITFGFAYNSVQSNTICLAWQKAFGIEPIISSPFLLSDGKRQKGILPL